MHRLNAKLDRVLAVLKNRTGRLQRVEGQLASLAARVAEIETLAEKSPALTRGSTSMVGV
jgi:hypothetical protein